MSETVYYEQDGVLVTNSRLVANGRTYSIGQVSSVDLRRKGVGCLAPLLVLMGMAFIPTGLGVVGFWIFPYIAHWDGFEVDALLLLVFGLPLLMLLLGAGLGLGMLIAGIWLARRNLATHIVQVVMAPSGRVALEYRDEDDALTVATALNQALANRS